MVKRCIFKLASALERVNLYTNGKVRARTVTLEVIDAELKDCIEFNQNKNPFAPQKNQDSVLVDQKDLFHIYSISRILNNEIERLTRINVHKKVLATQIIE